MWRGTLQSRDAIRRGSRRRTAGTRGLRRRSLPDSLAFDAMEPSFIWATFPIASALVAGMALHKATKIPLIVDLRDPMVYEGWPENRWRRATYSRIERRAVTLASAVVVTTPGARRLYIERYPHLPASRFRIIANGVDDTMDADQPPTAVTSGEPIVLVHSGLMEIPDRDPTAFFEAIAQMRKQGDIAEQTRCVSRCAQPAATTDYRRQIAALGIGDIVTIEGRISHAEALEEMRRADGLILFQGSAVQSANSGQGVRVSCVPAPDHWPG